MKGPPEGGLKAKYEIYQYWPIPLPKRKDPLKGLVSCPFNESAPRPLSSISRHIFLSVWCLFVPYNFLQRFSNVMSKFHGVGWWGMGSPKWTGGILIRGAHAYNSPSYYSINTDNCPMWASTIKGKLQTICITCFWLEVHKLAVIKNIWYNTIL